MPTRSHLLGQVFGYWTVLDDGANSPSEDLKYTCRCRCGVIRLVRARSLVHGKSNSCGCLHRELVTRRGFKHGAAARGASIKEQTLYNARKTMLQRCFNRRNARFKDYGGRGITVCQKWIVGFRLFWDDMQAGWAPGLSLGRVDNDGHYNSKNCRWMTIEDQNARDSKRQRQPNGNHHQAEEPF
jgi:hypothetical protein